MSGIDMEIEPAAKTQAARVTPEFIVQDERTRVLQHGETFAVLDRRGDAVPTLQGELGVYCRGTRHISALELRLFGQRPRLLGSSLGAGNEVLSVDLTHPESAGPDGGTIPDSVIHLKREKFILGEACYERIAVRNYGPRPLPVELSLSAGADFADIFEVRGFRRQARGSVHPPRRRGRSELFLGYTGLDGVERHTEIRFDPAPTRFEEDNSAIYRFELAPGEARRFDVTFAFRCGASAVDVAPMEEARSRLSAEFSSVASRFAAVATSHAQVNHWIDRSRADLFSLLGTTPQGLYPFAGVPWYNTVFGRDGIITALQTLWAAPMIARGVLLRLAATQATRIDPARDAEPGKILHEERSGEMADLGEIPFKRYYGSVDSTPLFVVLAGEYLRRTGDLVTIRALQPNIDAALEWIDRYGDIDGDGFVEYARRTDRGLTNQGWKDSHDSVSHADGTLADAPIALCEVQGYVYQARLAAAGIARALDEPESARVHEARAEDLRKAFNEKFWDEELGTYALALDGAKRPCRVVSSNAGHCLLSGIADADKAARIVTGLMSPRMFNGFGIRTLAEGESRYNPMSYHNGSVWPHDCSVIALGMANYGFHSEAARVMQALFDASVLIEFQRLPELFCGFRRAGREAPVPYPVACSPQAWAVGAVYQLLQAALGLRIDGLEKKIVLRTPRMPEFLDRVLIEGLPLGEADAADIAVHRYPKDVLVEVTRKPDGWKVLVEK